jgi:hypothetical protein
LADWTLSRAVELTSTAVDIAPFGLECGFSQAFGWDDERRLALRCELDAAFFHIYGLAEEDVDHVLETFPIVKRLDEQSYGHYRTKALILDVYRRMRDAIERGVSYETLLDPPPAGPSVADARREPASAVRE